MRIVLATHNPGKLAEFRRLLAPVGVELLSAGDFGLKAPAETGTTFAMNARLKAEAVARALGVAALADDSGLCVEALGGLPGVATADWTVVAGKRDDMAGMRRVRDAVVARGGTLPASAWFECALHLAEASGDGVSVSGRVTGRIVWPPRGVGGHGYDPVFEPEGSVWTFAEMVGAEKDLFSHRARAVRALVEERFT